MQTFLPSTGLPRLAAPICARASQGPGPCDDEELGSVAVAGQHAKRSSSVSHSIRTDVRVDEAQDVKKLRKGERQKKPRTSLNASSQPVYESFAQCQRLTVAVKLP